MKKALLLIPLLLLLGCSDMANDNKDRYKINACENAGITIYSNNGTQVDGFVGNEARLVSNPSVCETDYAILRIYTQRISFETYSAYSNYKTIYDANGYYYKISYYNI